MAHTEDLVRELAGRGRLSAYARTASENDRRDLRAAATGIVYPLVFLRVTRQVERRRGHRLCASAVQRLAPECLDRFHDDVEAVVDDLFTHADVPIANLEGWLVMRMPRAIVDAYRRRRGERGAPQKPRPPQWLLREGLGGDAWLGELARLILEWVGVEATAGATLWPLSEWTERRARQTGDTSADERTVAGEIEHVLAAMRRRRSWYDKYVERPLGRKQAPVWFPAPEAEGTPLVLVPAYEREDALLRELAGLAITLIRERIGAGEKPGDVVPGVLAAVFGSLPAEPGLDEVTALIDDPARLDRIVTVALTIVNGPSER
ncbi:hypothetical protein [Actinoplanes sp. NPDC051851]|uniref:hypothetical protein n=1 Tax=Actinoplanes sp. NPDC051851 TaxID=3154753 RepID=UPI0034150374